MAQNRTLSRKQTRFVTALVTCRSVREAAGMARIGERTAWTWLQSREVRRAANAALDAVLAAATHDAAGRMCEALRVLDDIMHDENAPASARVSAARCILETGLRYHEQLTLTERVAALEELLEARDEKHRNPY